MRCKAITCKGRRCGRNAVVNGLCILHQYPCRRTGPIRCKDCNKIVAYHAKRCWKCHIKHVKVRKKQYLSSL